MGADVNAKNCLNLAMQDIRTPNRDLHRGIDSQHTISRWQSIPAEAARLRS